MHSGKSRPKPACRQRRRPEGNHSTACDVKLVLSRQTAGLYADGDVPQNPSRRVPIALAAAWTTPDAIHSHYLLSPNPGAERERSADLPAASIRRPMCSGSCRGDRNHCSANNAKGERNGIRLCRPADSEPLHLSIDR